MRNLTLAIGLLTALAAITPAEAAPTRINFTGRLSTSAGPVTGTVDLTFALFSSSDGNAVWTETQSGIAADHGLVFVELGALSPLDTAVLTGNRMFLEITIDGETLSPRLAINSVPYAINATAADRAATLGGTIGPGDVVTGAAGSGGISAAKSGNTLNISLATTGCASGHVYKYNGSTWSCQPDAGAVYTGAGAIAVSGTTISLSTTGCSAGEVWKYNGTAFACEPDANTIYSGAGGIAVNGSTISLSTTGCVAGEVWKFNGSAFSCEADGNTTYSAGPGLDLSGTTFSVPAGGITMSRLNLPKGTGASAATLSASGRISPAGATFTPEGTGQCLVTAHLTTFESINATGSVLIQVSRGGALFGPVQALTTASGTTRYSGSVSALVNVTAGVSTVLSCEVGISSSSSFLGNSFDCFITYVCF